MGVLAEIEDLVGPTQGERGGSTRREWRHPLAVHAAEPTRLQATREALLRWYDVHRRKLPWRGDPPPYMTTAAHTQQQQQPPPSTASRQRKGHEGKRKRGAVGTMDAFCVIVKAEPHVKDEPAIEPPPTASLGQSVPLMDDAIPKIENPPVGMTPYKTWVSEIMLQQTRVDTVVDYFVRWMDTFPTVAALAAANEEDVNALWAGLGYYRRARMLHAGAKFVMEKFDGELPSSTEELLTIPGIGPYTAGAISSIAFNNCEPLVDGNVIRVVARMRGIGADPKNKQLINFSWKVARELVQDCSRPGALNQSIMELGATVCTTQNPMCSTCPVQSSCLAYEEYTNKQDKVNDDGDDCDLCDESRYDEWEGTANNYEVTRYPLKAKKNESKKEAICVAVISHVNKTTDTIPADAAAPHDHWRFLMCKRPEGGLLAGQWEFVHSKVSDDDKIPSYSQRKTHLKPKFAELFSDVASVLATSNSSLERRDLGELVHIFSHVKHHMGIEHLHFDDLPPLQRAKEIEAGAVGGLRWMSLADMDQLGITTGVRKILQLVVDKRPASGKRPVPKKPSSVKNKATTTSKGVTKKASKRPSPRTKQEPAGAHVADTVPKRLKTLRSFFRK